MEGEPESRRTMPGRFAEIAREQVNKKYHTNQHILYLMQHELSLPSGNDYDSAHLLARLTRLRKSDYSGN